MISLTTETREQPTLPVLSLADLQHEQSLRIRENTEADSYLEISKLTEILTGLTPVDPLIRPQLSGKLILIIAPEILPWETGEELLAGDQKEKTALDWLATPLRERGALVMLTYDEGVLNRLFDVFKFDLIISQQLRGAEVSEVMVESNMDQTKLMLLVELGHYDRHHNAVIAHQALKDRSSSFGFQPKQDLFKESLTEEVRRLLVL